jgi:hypothetical protein
MDLHFPKLTVISTVKLKRTHWEILTDWLIQKPMARRTQKISVTVMLIQRQMD